MKKLLLFHAILPLDFLPLKRSEFTIRLDTFNVKPKLALFRNIAKSAKRHPSREYLWTSLKKNQVAPLTNPLPA
ncbi:MAG: hypothetical protein HGA97_12625 [Chlorobiaceae bacterium]|nr:hypothetical protein [Chlorobiaceae bacterium]